MSTVERLEMEHPAHFVGAADCKFWRATKVGPWVVSSVGDYRPRGVLTEMCDEWAARAAEALP